MIFLKILELSKKYKYKIYIELELLDDKALFILNDNIYDILYIIIYFSNYFKKPLKLRLYDENKDNIYNFEGFLKLKENFKLLFNQYIKYKILILKIKNLLGDNLKLMVLSNDEIKELINKDQEFLSNNISKINQTYVIKTVDKIIENYLKYFTGNNLINLLKNEIK